MKEHDCVWGPVEQSWITKTPHRKCQIEDCRMISLDLDDDDMPPGEDAIYSLDLSPHQFDDEQPRSLERFHLDDDTGPQQPYLGEM